MRVKDTWNTRNGRIKFEIYHEKATGVHIYIETKFSKMGGISTKVKQAHEAECQELFNRAVMQAKRADERKAAA